MTLELEERELRALGQEGMFKLLKYLFRFERERRERTRGGQAERERDPESEVGSRLRAVSTEPAAGLEPMPREITT